VIMSFNIVHLLEVPYQSGETRFGADRIGHDHQRSEVKHEQILSVCREMRSNSIGLSR
jgi:hypothetical protein